MIKPSEFQILLLAITLAPLLGWVYREIDLPRKRWLAVAWGAMMIAYVATVAEGFAAPLTLNVLEHLLYATSGVCFAVAMAGLPGWSMRAEKAADDGTITDPTAPADGDPAGGPR